MKFFITGIALLGASLGTQAVQQDDIQQLAGAFHNLALMHDMVTIDWIKKHHQEWLVDYDPENNLYQVAVLPQKSDEESPQHAFRNLAYLMAIFSGSTTQFDTLKSALLKEEGFSNFQKAAGVTPTPMKIKGHPTLRTKILREAAKIPHEFPLTLLTEPIVKKITDGCLTGAIAADCIPHNAKTFVPQVTSIAYSLQQARSAGSAPKSVPGFLLAAVTKIEGKSAAESTALIRNALLVGNCVSLAPLEKIRDTDPFVIGIQLNFDDHVAILIVQKYNGVYTYVLADSQGIPLKTKGGFSESYHDVFLSIKALIENKETFKDALTRSAYARTQQSFSSDKLHAYKALFAFFEDIKKNHLAGHSLFQGAYKIALCAQTTRLIGELPHDPRITLAMKKRYLTALEEIRTFCSKTAAEAAALTPVSAETKQINKEALISKIGEIKSYEDLFTTWDELKKNNLLNHPLFKDTYKQVLINKARELLNKLQQARIKLGLKKRYQAALEELAKELQ